MDKKVAVILMGIVVIFVFGIAIKQFFVLQEKVYIEAYYGLEE